MLTTVILQFILTFTEAHGEPPTVADIEAKFDWITPDTANDWVQSALSGRLHRMAAWQAVKPAGPQGTEVRHET